MRKFESYIVRKMNKIKFTFKSIILIIFSTILGLGTFSLTLYYLELESLSFILLINILTLSLLAAIMYLFYIVWNKPEAKFYLRILRVLSIFSFGMGILLEVDYFLPNKIYQGKVDIKRLEGDSYVIYFGIYTEAVYQNVFETLKIGERVLLEITPIFNEIDSIQSLDNQKVSFDKGTVDESVTLSMALAFLLFPLVLYFFTPNLGNKFIKFLYLNSIIFSLILSLVSLALWVKLLFVHIFHVIEKM